MKAVLGTGPIKEVETQHSSQKSWMERKHGVANDVSVSVSKMRNALTVRSSVCTTKESMTTYSIRSRVWKAVAQAGTLWGRIRASDPGKHSNCHHRENVKFNWSDTSCEEGGFKCHRELGSKQFSEIGSPTLEIALRKCISPLLPRKKKDHRNELLIKHKNNQIIIIMTTKY